MTPEQMRNVADRLRRRYPPPHPGMTPGRYVSCETVHAFADALDEEAHAEEQDHALEVAEERRALGLEP